MAGKKKTGTKSSGWGGERSGSGRKPSVSITEQQIKALVTKAFEWAKKEKKDINDILLSILYGKPVGT